MVWIWLMEVFSQSQLNIYFKGNVETKAMVHLLIWVDGGQRAHRNELIEFDARFTYGYDCQASLCTQGRWSAWLRRTISEYKIQRKTEGGSRHGFKKKPREPWCQAARVTTVETRPKAPRILDLRAWERVLKPEKREKTRPGRRLGRQIGKLGSFPCPPPPPSRTPTPGGKNFKS